MSDKPGYLFRTRWLRSPKVILSILSLVLIAVLVLKAGSARRDFIRAFERIRLSDLPWLAVAAGAEIASLACYGAAQHRLLRAGGAGLRFRTVWGLTVAATGISSVVPGGVVPAGGWLVSQLRMRKVAIHLAMWAVLAGGFAATVSVLALLLVGAGIAGLGRPAVLGASGGVLLLGSAGFVVGVHRLDRVERFVRRHHWRSGVRAAHWICEHASGITRYRAGFWSGLFVFGCSVLNWLLDTACLLAAFATVGLPLPWRAALFAYAVSQVAASVIPLPAGIGVVEGGMLGVLAATGTPAGHALAAIVVYRIMNYWSVAGVGSLLAVLISHRPAGGEAAGGSRDRQAAATDTSECGPVPEPGRSPSLS